jgi:N-acetylmuramoyl-L-alanine amidase
MATMKIRLLLIILYSPLVFAWSAELKGYHKAQALPGDGIYSLLRRFQLDQYSCNFDKFYSLNNLKRNAPLRVGREYALPIMVYAFNGKTIRSSIGIDDWDTAVRIQNYNDKMLEIALREASFKKDNILWVPYHELNCPKPDLSIPPPDDDDQPESAGSGSGARIFPIFGKEYEHTPLISNKLRGKVFYIVGGHGGPDPGAMTTRAGRNLCEDEYAYDVALRLCRNLIAHGATAYMINRDPNDGIRSGNYLPCDTDEVLWGNIKMDTRQKTRLTQRSEVINELYEKHRLQGVTDQKIIIIHVDSRNTRERIDLFFYHHPDSPESREVAQQLHRKMRQKYKKYRKTGEYHGTVTARDLHMLRETKAPSIYVELANIRNQYDQQRIILESNRRALADWLLEGLMDD